MIVNLNSTTNYIAKFYLQLLKCKKFTLQLNNFKNKTKSIASLFIDYILIIADKIIDNNGNDKKG
jgi:hypothetical protein